MGRMTRKHVEVRQDPRKMKYIEWLTTPPPERQPATEEEFARLIDVYPKTLYNWRHDRSFKEVWQDETDEVVGGEDRRQRVIDTLWEAASDPHNPRHVAAAKEYREWLKAMSPDKERREEPTKALSMMSTDEIKDLLARGIQERPESVAS